MKVVRLSEAAQHDYAAILTWTAKHFSRQQANHYHQTLQQALRNLATGVADFGCKARPDLGAHIHTYHVNRTGRRGRHVLVFQESADNGVQVLRILHDSMHFANHLP